MEVYVVEEGRLDDRYLVRPDIRATVLHGVFFTEGAAIEYAAAWASERHLSGNDTYYDNPETGEFVGVRREVLR